MRRCVYHAVFITQHCLHLSRCVYHAAWYVSSPSHAQGRQHVALLCLNGGGRRNVSIPNLGAAAMRESWVACQGWVVRNAGLARARRVHQETELQRHRGRSLELPGEVSIKLKMRFMSLKSRARLLSVRLLVHFPSMHATLVSINRRSTGQHSITCGSESWCYRYWSRHG